VAFAAVLAVDNNSILLGKSQVARRICLENDVFLGGFYLGSLGAGLVPLNIAV
jgi:hypothetical protein